MNTYFDNAATTKTDDEVLSEMLPYFNILYGNPSSNNSCGIKIRDALDNARLEVAKFLNVTPSEIIFTSGATESNNLVIKSCVELCDSEIDEPCHFIFSEIEHKSVLNLKDYLENKGHEVDLISVLPSGLIDLEDLENKIKDNTVLVSCIWVNNETGIIQPIEEISEICLNANIHFHVDGTQAFGKIPLDLSSIKIDFLSLSAHKLHGPKGVGALYKNKDIELQCQIIGGSQEDGFRSGTENVSGIIGLGKATEISAKNLIQNTNYLERLEKYLFKKLNSYGFQYILNGDIENKVPWINNIAFLDTDAETLVERMSDFCFSKSSACSKGNYPSHILQAMNVDDDLIEKSIRLSFSKYNTFEQIDSFCEKLSKII
jgi:cysteine desulfurase